MRVANILTAIAASLWFGLALMGHGLVAGVAQRLGGSVLLAQADGYVLFPMGVVAALLACAWVCNVWRRWHSLLAFVAGLSLAAILPFVVNDLTLAANPLKLREYLAAHTRHFFSEFASNGSVSHLRLSIYPDGGVSRLRVWGQRDE